MPALLGVFHVKHGQRPSVCSRSLPGSGLDSDGVRPNLSLLLLLYVENAVGA